MRGDTSGRQRVWFAGSIPCALTLVLLLALAAATGCHGKGSGNVITDEGYKITPTAVPEEKKGGVGPTIVTVDPPNGSTGVSVSAAISAVFSANMDPASIDGQSFVLADESGAEVGGSVKFMADILTAKFTPQAPLKDATAYVATVRTKAKSALGNPMAADHAWRFTTGDILITATPDKMSHTDIAKFEFTSDKKKFECKLDAGEFLPCASPKLLNNLSAGRHSFSARGMDPQGHPGTNAAAFEWEVFAQLAGGAVHGCAIQIDGRLFCWGFNEYGQVGDGTNLNIRTAPVIVGSDRWLAVDAGIWHTCGIRANGRLFCWGRNLFGQLGAGSLNDENSPLRVVADPFDTWAAVSAGGEHACGIKAGGGLFCWGRNDLGQLGDGKAVGKNTPVPVEGGGRWTAVSAGYDHSCGIKDDGSLLCWGNNAHGALGVANVQQSSTPIGVGGGRWRQVIAGYAYTCGIKIDDTVYCWGWNSDGQLGDGTYDDRNSPASVGSGWNMVSVGVSHTCGIKADRKLQCWGNNSRGQVGDGTNEPMRNTPVTIGASQWVDVAVGFGHTCGLTSDNKIFCWGDNTAGQLGIAGAVLGAPGPETILP